MWLTSWLSSTLPSKKARRARRPRRLLHGLWLEDRTVPAGVSLGAGILNITYFAGGSTPESVTIGCYGSTIAVSGDGIAGNPTFAAASVSKINVNAIGVSTPESLSLIGTAPFALANGLASIGVETLTVNNALTATGSGSIAVSAATITTNKPVTLSGGSLNLGATNGITLNDAVTTGGGDLTLNADSDANGTGTLTVAPAVLSSWSQQARPTAGGGGADAKFGFSVAVSGDEANGTSLSVMDLLLAVNARSHNGLLYDQNGDGQISSSEAGLRTMANDVFSAINEAGGM
jgi:hypothetical protein